MVVFSLSDEKKSADKTTLSGLSGGYFENRQPPNFTVERMQ